MYLLGCLFQRVLNEHQKTASSGVPSCCTHPCVVSKGAGDDQQFCSSLWFRLRGSVGDFAAGWRWSAGAQALPFDIP